MTRSQLRGAALGRGAIDHRIAAGRLVVVHRGVYAVGHRPHTRHAAWMAAVLACGDGAVLSHRSAAALWGIRRWAPARAEVTTATQRRRPGVAVHVRRTTPAERDVRFGIPVTTVARTIVDPGQLLGADELERVVRETEFQKRLDIAAIRRSLPWRPAPALTAVLDRIAPTQSRHEDRLLRICRRFDLPAPLTQQRIGPPR